MITTSFTRNLEIDDKARCSSTYDISRIELDSPTLCRERIVRSEHSKHSKSNGINTKLSHESAKELELNEKSIQELLKELSIRNVMCI